MPQAPPALLLHTVPGRRQQATLAALQGLRPEGETVLPAGIQPSKPHCFCIKMTRGSFVDYTRRCEPRVLRPGWRRLTGRACSAGAAACCPAGGLRVCRVARRG